MDELAMHPTVKPVAMVKDAIMDCSQHGDIVLDPFGGSGTTLIAVEQAGRIGYLMELDPHYVDVILSRYEKQFSVEPVLSETGKTFSEVMKERQSVSDSSAINTEDENDENIGQVPDDMEVSHE